MKKHSLTNSQSQLTLDPHGGRITLQLHDLPILTKVTRGDGKEGSTHPCTPNFDEDIRNLFGLQRHGITRNQTIKDITSEGTTLSFTHAITDPGYPKGLILSQKHTLENNIYTLEMTHTNTGEIPMPVNSGEHCYFDAPAGFVGTMINGQELSKMIETHRDGVPLPLNEENEILIPGKPLINLAQSGFEFAMVWVGTDPKSRKDQNYVCIEPVESNPMSNFFGSEESMIEPEQSRTAILKLSLKL